MLPSYIPFYQVIRKKILSSKLSDDQKSQWRDYFKTTYNLWKPSKITADSKFRWLLPEYVAGKPPSIEPSDELLGVASGVDVTETEELLTHVGFTKSDKKKKRLRELNPNKSKQAKKQ
jgi:hypothetical protein